MRLLDFPHAVEHLTAAAQATFPAADDHAATWVATQAHTLKHGDPMPVLLALVDLPVQAAPQPEVAVQARRQQRRRATAAQEYEPLPPW